MPIISNPTGCSEVLMHSMVSEVCKCSWNSICC